MMPSSEKETVMRKYSVLRGVSVAVAAALLGFGVVGRAEAGPGGPPAEFKAAATAAFTEADADGSGELSAAEFVNFHDILRAKMEALRFAHLDADGSGGLTQAELAAGHHGPGHGPHGPAF
jgi:hypothetical protein